MGLNIRRTIAICITFTILLLNSTKSFAEKDFNFTLYGGSSNFWSNTIFQIPASYLSNVTTMLISDEGYMGGSYRYDFFSAKENGEKVHLYKGKFFGFKAKDLFSNIHYGLKFGWAPRFSPFGVYISCAYQFRRFEADFSNIGHNTYKLNSIRPGIGIRVTPFIGLVEDGKFSPVVEVGTSYNYHFKMKGPFENDKDQFNSGMISTFSIGARNQYFSITGGVEIDHFSIFNKNFTPDGGITFPYEDVKTKHLTIFIALSHEFN